MKRYIRHIFDLDGTLIDSRDGVTHSIQYALVRLGITETDRGLFTGFIGPPLLESFRKWYGLDESKARQAVDYYREYFASKGMFENRIYEGIPALIRGLDSSECRLAVATSKPTLYTERILDHFGLRQYFDVVVGSNMDLTRTSKKEIIAEILRVLPNAKEPAVVIGDRADDIMAARAFDLDSVAVGYGYGSEFELDETEPTYVVRTVSELTSLLLWFIRE
jgi:phosphoglycolate phosphatase